MDSQAIVGPPTGTARTVLRFARHHRAKREAEVAAFVEELFSLGIRCGYDPFMIAVQSAVETGLEGVGGGWLSRAWEKHLNPGGIGITHDGALSPTWANGADAARAMLVHHAAYLGSLPAALVPYVGLDPHYHKVAEAGLAGSVRVWGDYGNGRWAVDPGYTAAIANRARAIRAFETVTDPNEEDPVMTPPIIDRFLEGKCYPNRRWGEVQGRPAYIVVHCQEGFNAGSYERFLTDDASATVMIGLDGGIWRVVREQDAAWANGDVRQASQKARDGILRLGPFPHPDPNLWSLSIEAEGFHNGQHPQVQLDAIIWQVKTWMRRYNIPARNILRHSDINGDRDRDHGRWFCPGDAVYVPVIAAAEEVTVRPNRAGYVNPTAPPSYDGNDKRLNGVLFHAAKGEVRAAVDGLNCREWARRNAFMTRPPLVAGEAFDVLYWIEGEKVEGEARWWVTASGSRIWSGGTDRRPAGLRFTPRITVPVLAGRP